MRTQMWIQNTRLALRNVRTSIASARAELNKLEDKVELADKLIDSGDTRGAAEVCEEIEKFLDPSQNVHMG